ncbi:MAG TPA: GxxExxY protein [Chitinophagaceae bacterium]|jgi:GxxExxY protein|nr:GxxExxY protein [Chitinophagaceae bacterium]
MGELIFKEESYKIVGVCMEVHRSLGLGFKEAVYKDALEVGFKNQQIPFIREKQYRIEYKGVILPHKYYADFIIYSSIILEVKSTAFIIDNLVAQTINYLKASGIRLGIIANFGERSFTYKRVVF